MREELEINGSSKDWLKKNKGILEYLLAQQASEPEPVEGSFIESLLTKDGVDKLKSRIVESKSGRIDFSVTEGGAITAAVSSPIPDTAAPPAAQVGDPDLAAAIEAIRPKVRLEGEKTGHLDVLRAVKDGRWSSKVRLLVPCITAINPNVVFGMCAQIRRQPWLGLDMEIGTIIHRSRNELARKFLASDAEWCVWTSLTPLFLACLGLR